MPSWRSGYPLYKTLVKPYPDSGWLGVFIGGIRMFKRAFTCLPVLCFKIWVNFYMATFLRQSDCGGEPDANPNRLRDPDAISRSVKSNKIFTQVLDPDGKVSHMKVYFIFNEDKNCRKEGRLTSLKTTGWPARSRALVSATGHRPRGNYLSKKCFPAPLLLAL